MIAVKDVSQKEWRPPHSHYLSTCQSICLCTARCSEDWQTLFTKATFVTCCAMRTDITPVASIKNPKVLYQKTSDWKLGLEAITSVSRSDQKIISNVKLILFLFAEQSTQHDPKMKGQMPLRWETLSAILTFSMCNGACTNTSVQFLTIIIQNEQTFILLPTKKNTFGQFLFINAPNHVTPHLQQQGQTNLQSDLLN